MKVITLQPRIPIVQAFRIGERKAQIGICWQCNDSESETGAYCSLFAEIAICVCSKLFLLNPNVHVIVRRCVRHRYNVVKCKLIVVDG